MENLQFLQSIIIYRNSINMDDHPNMNESNQFLERLYEIDLKYLDEAHIQQIQNGNIDKIHAIARQIYDQFIDISSSECINISWDARNILNEFFNQQQSSDNKSIYVYLNIFNHAIMEIYSLLETRYSTDFKNKYINV